MVIVVRGCGRKRRRGREAGGGEAKLATSSALQALPDQTGVD